jgi:peptide/nickel transport system substrate-binding protein
MVSTDPVDGRVGQIIQAMAGEAGFDVKLVTVESATLLSHIKAGTYEMALLIWSGRADPDANISIWVACDGFVNWSKYCNPKVDALLRTARATADVAERAKLYADAAAIYLADRSYIFLYHLKWFCGTTKKLSGFVPHPDGIIRFTGLKLAK